MSDALLSTLDSGSSLLLNIDCSIDSGDSCDYVCTSESEAPLTNVSLGAAGECAERLHSLAILGMYKLLLTGYIHHKICKSWCFFKCTNCH